jgi:CubicO group peptidase (beta-lactamase class C family)
MHQPVKQEVFTVQRERMPRLMIASTLIAAMASCARAMADEFPGKTWTRCTPAHVGLDAAKLDVLARHVGGRGCVIRGGCLVYQWGDVSKSSDIASAVKPVISTLLFMAVQEGKLNSVDAVVSDSEPRLKSLNGGKDAAITWRHLANQTSGYGLAERPGEAYSYNDYALALYYDSLMSKVYGASGDAVLKEHLADRLRFEDDYTFEAFGPQDRPGRLAISVRDLARFGLLYLRGGKWNQKQLIHPAFVRMAIESPLPADTPRTSGKEAAMLAGQRTLGGTRNITPIGPGYYSFNWWLNRTDKQGRRLYVNAPHDACVASGHGGKRALWVIPSLDLVVAWNDSRIEDHDTAPGNADSANNIAARQIVEAVERPASTSHSD